MCARAYFFTLGRLPVQTGARVFNWVGVLAKCTNTAEKIKTVDLRQPNPDPMAADKVPFLFPDYAGGCDHDAALKYILNKFLQQNKLPRREIFYQVRAIW
ncbi:hypothetical protein EON66_03590 [archaeon]|nr:MAG: hypothetical protein EON66_03590 [archaeon]